MTVSLSGWSYLAQAQIEVTPNEARTKVGALVTVKGKIAQVSIRSKVCYLNFTYRYPDNEFVAVIFKQNFKKFGDLRKYEGKTVKITGKVSVYRGNPQIKLHNPSKIEIIE